MLFLPRVRISRKVGCKLIRKSIDLQAKNLSTKGSDKNIVVQKIARKGFKNRFQKSSMRRATYQKVANVGTWPSLITAQNKMAASSGLFFCLGDLPITRSQSARTDFYATYDMRWFSVSMCIFGATKPKFKM